MSQGQLVDINHFKQEQENAKLRRKRLSESSDSSYDNPKLNSGMVADKLLV